MWGCDEGWGIGRGWGGRSVDSGEGVAPLVAQRPSSQLEFEHICAERAVLPKLNELDRLLEEQGAIPPEVGARAGGAPVLRR